ncbi:hypothetical protein ACFPM0_28390 [Pseudonocardia sulfidoxydans]
MRRRLTHLAVPILIRRARRSNRHRILPLPAKRRRVRGPARWPPRLRPGG